MVCQFNNCVTKKSLKSIFLKKTKQSRLNATCHLAMKKISSATITYSSAAWRPCSFFLHLILQQRVISPHLHFVVYTPAYLIYLQSRFIFSWIKYIHNGSISTWPNESSPRLSSYWKTNGPYQTRLSVLASSLISTCSRAYVKSI